MYVCVNCLSLCVCACVLNVGYTKGQCLFQEIVSLPFCSCISICWLSHGFEVANCLKV